MPLIDYTGGDLIGAARALVPVSEWSAERMERLRDLLDGPLSTSQIGAELGVSKNAVIGKAHRMLLPPRTKSEASLDRFIERLKIAARRVGLEAVVTLHPAIDADAD
jgi:hypothetical protein